MTYNRYRGRLNHELNNYMAGCANYELVRCSPPVSSTCTKGSQKYACGRNSKTYELRLYQSLFWRLLSQMIV